jgi:hypothetical protein
MMADPAASVNDTLRRAVVRPHRGPLESTWFRVDYSLNYFKPASLPIPIAVGSIDPTGPVLLGEDRIQFGNLQGIGVEGGHWLNPCNTFGVGLGGFLIEQRSRFASVSAAELSRPFFDVLAGGPNALIVASPGVAEGTVAYGASTRFAGAEANLWWNLAECQWCSVNFFTGFRYYDLHETLAIYQTTIPLQAGLQVANQAVPIGATISLLDRIRTRNQFYGGQIGGRFEARRGIVFANVSPRVAFGPNHQSVYFDGRTTVSDHASVAGGLFAVGTEGRPGQIGRDVTNYFTVATEVGMQTGIQLTSGMRMAVGYNFLYLNNVARPGNQINPAVNPRLVPASAAFGSLSGPAAPFLTVNREDFYVHGGTLSIEFMY